MIGKTSKLENQIADLQNENQMKEKVLCKLIILSLKNKQKAKQKKNTKKIEN